jgi:AcrR family transcriptional regulator
MMESVFMAIQQAAKKLRIAKPQEERRIDLLNASAVIFARNGVADAKVEDITELAGVSKGTFYLYFDSKDVAASELWQRYIDEFIQIGESVLADERLSSSERIASVFEALSRYVLSKAEMHRTVYRAADAQAVKIAANQRLIELIVKTVQRGISKGELSCDEPELSVRFLYHGICGGLHDAISAKAPLRTNTLIKTGTRLAQMIFPALEGKVRAAKSDDTSERAKPASRARRG